MRVPAQGTETTGPRKPSGHNEQHDVPGGGGPGCYRWNCGHYGRNNAPHDAHDFPGGRPGLQLCYPTAPHHLRKLKEETDERSGVFFFCKERMIRIPVFFACGGRRLAYAAPFGSRYVFFAFLEPFRFACPAPPHLFGSTSPKTKNCKLIYEILQRYVGTGTPNATPLGSAIGFVVALSSIWNYDLRNGTGTAFTKSRLHLLRLL